MTTVKHGCQFDTLLKRCNKNFMQFVVQNILCSVFFIIAVLSSIGLPGLNGFVGEFLILFGAFRADAVWGILAASGVVLGALYMLKMTKMFLFGPLVHDANRNVPDLQTREILYLSPFVIMMVWLGLYPTTFTKLVQPTLSLYVQMLQN